MAGQGTPIPKHLRSAILTALHQGASFRAAARQYGVSAMAVSRLAKECGIPARTRPAANTYAGLANYHQTRQYEEALAGFDMAERMLAQPDLPVAGLLKALHVMNRADTQMQKALRGGR